MLILGISGNRGTVPYWGRNSTIRARKHSQTPRESFQGLLGGPSLSPSARPGGGCFRFHGLGFSVQGSGFRGFKERLAALLLGQDALESRVGGKKGGGREEALVRFAKGTFASDCSDKQP